MAKAPRRPSFHERVARTMEVIRKLEVDSYTGIRGTTPHSVHPHPVAEWLAFPGNLLTPGQVIPGEAPVDGAGGVLAQHVTPPLQHPQDFGAVAARLLALEQQEESRDIHRVIRAARVKLNVLHRAGDVDAVAPSGGQRVSPPGAGGSYEPLPSRDNPIAFGPPRRRPKSGRLHLETPTGFLHPVVVPGVARAAWSVADRIYPQAFTVAGSGYWANLPASPPGMGLSSTQAARLSGSPDGRPRDGWWTSGVYFYGWEATGSGFGLADRMQAHDYDSVFAHDVGKMNIGPGDWTDAEHEGAMNTAPTVTVGPWPPPQNYAGPTPVQSISLHIPESWIRVPHAPLLSSLGPPGARVAPSLLMDQYTGKMDGSTTFEEVVQRHEEVLEDSELAPLADWVEDALREATRQRVYDQVWSIRRRELGAGVPVYYDAGVRITERYDTTPTWTLNDA